MPNKFTEQKQNIKVLESVLKNKTKQDLIKTREFLSNLMKYKKVAKLHNTYVSGTRKAISNTGQNKVFCDYRVAEVVTGRLSCAAYTAGKGTPLGVSFHTLPRETDYNIRQVFCAPKGWNFITADYKAMEMRFMAHASQDANMIKAFLSGEDLHSYSASLVFNKPIDKVTKHERQLAKATSFLIIYGGGEYTLAKNFNIKVSEAAKIINDYRVAFPDVFTYMAECENTIVSTGEIKSIFGRIRHLPDIKSISPKVKARAIRQGINFTIQSASSDILLSALVGLQKSFYASGLESKVVGVVHDSLEVICPASSRVETLALVKKHMVSNPVLKSAFNIDFSVPFEIDVEVGHSFGDGIEVKYGPDGTPSNWMEINEYFNAA